MSNYPPALRSVLKAVPSVLTLFTMGTIFGLACYNFVRRPQDHAPRFYFRTNRFERGLRYRDDKIRTEYQEALNFNPNTDL